MAAVTTAVIGVAVTAATVGASFAQAEKQKKAAKDAQQAAEKSLSEAEKILGVNYYKSLSIQKEPYELEREANLVAGAQATEAGVESERGAAATAGRVQMAQQAGQRQIAAAMGTEMSGIEKIIAEEESRLRDAKAQIEMQKAAGAQAASADAAKASAIATQQGVQSAVSMAQQLADTVPLYPKIAGAKAADKLMADYAKNPMLDASGKPIDFNTAFKSKVNPAIGIGIALPDWLRTQSKDTIKGFQGWQNFGLPISGVNMGPGGGGREGVGLSGMGGFGDVSNTAGIGG
jgi:hypothetical protein